MADLKQGNAGEWLKDIGSPLPSKCQWCGKKVSAKQVRVVKVNGRLFSVCPSCPPVEAEKQSDRKEGSI